MTTHVDLLNERILPALSKLALPIMATSLIQMAYNLTDMIWIGFLGADSVAAVGAAGMFVILINGLSTMCRTGGQIKVGQCLGQHDPYQASQYAQSAIQMGIVLSILCGIICVIFASPMVSFFNFSSAQVVNDATIYLIICCGLTIFQFLNTIFTGILTAMGSSKVCLQATGVGLVANIILDPIMIFGFGFIPAMGVAGAAIATVTAQFVVCLLFIVVINKDHMVFDSVHLIAKPLWDRIKVIVMLGAPTAADTAFYSIISMFIARIIADYGDAAVAVQKVGAQIESITWMIAQGYGAALSSFVAQNCGAGKIDRIKQGYRLSIGLLTAWGGLTTVLLYCGATMIFSIFIREADVIPMGVHYLQILAISQIAMAIEYGVNGLFSGLGQTMIPSTISVIFTVIRVPMAMLLGHAIGLDGVWWTLTLTSILKTTLLLIIYFFKKHRPGFYSPHMVQPH